MQNSSKRRSTSFVLALFLTGAVLSATAASAETATAKRREALADLPRCAETHGSLVIKEPGEDWWTPLGLPSPEAVLKLYVTKSGCFKLLDRGRGFEVAQQERALAAGGEIADPVKLAKGQTEAADFALVPDLVAKNADASGSRITAVAGLLVGGVFGELLGRVKITSKDSDVTLSLSDIRTSTQTAIAEGHSEKTDWGFGSGGGFANIKSALGIDLGSYENTEMGQVVMLAYLDAYKKMVSGLGYKAEVPVPQPMEGKPVYTTP